MDSRALARAFPLVNDHPDVAGVLRDAHLLREITEALAVRFEGSGVTKVAGPETRGMVIGALVAREIGAGLVCARREGRNHPGADLHFDSSPTWTGSVQSFQMRSFDLEPGDIVGVVDDWITTGNSLRAVVEQIRSTGATYAGGAVIVDKSTDAIRDELDVRALVTFDQIMDR